MPSAWATSAIGRPAWTRSKTLRRNSGGYPRRPMLRSYRSGSTESNNATPLKWGKTRVPGKPTLLANSSLVVVWHRSVLRGVDERMGRCLEVGDVVASQRVHADPRRDGAGGQGGVSQGVPGDARPRRAGHAVHRRAVRRA